MTNKQDKDFAAVDSRRSDDSMRKMSASRRLTYAVGVPILRFLLWLLSSTYRYRPVQGDEHIDGFIKRGELCAPSYWHEQHILCSSTVHGWIKRGFRACFLVSASVDGEIPERVARIWGAEVIRGSASRSGALALRDMQGMMKAGYSIVTTADGPRGPLYEFKSGTVLMARIAGVPIIPVACAADRAWRLDRWDKFMIPKPFARVAVAIGKPYPIPREIPLDGIEPHRLAVQEAVMSLMADCETAVKKA